MKRDISKNNFINILIWLTIIIVIFGKLNLLTIPGSTSVSRLSKIYKITKEDALEAIIILDENAYYANTDEWKTKREEYIKKIENARTEKMILNYLGDAVRTAGGKHSLVFAGIDMNNPTLNLQNDTKLNYYVEDNILIIELIGIYPSSQLSQETLDLFQEYADEVASAIYTNHEVDGIILDMSKGVSGSIVPQISGLSPLFPDGNILKYISNNGGITKEAYIDGGLFYQTNKNPEETFTFELNNYKEKIDKPVAVIINERVASAGEILLIGLMNLDNVKTFGSETAGFTSGNATFNIGENIAISLTITKTMDNTGIIYEEEPIESDVKTFKTKDVAIEWIKQ